ncbi:SDR family NAD(P)-dependent oxidoreductase [Paraburkholderia sp. SG-MS1]|uniref:SDR family NAD(P)-dependent oxidoreductase n=1 Tax=Paraburkholderia sp. SG-MS1 TaxID=2023741 RepID=UPI00406CBD18
MRHRAAPLQRCIVEGEESEIRAQFDVNVFEFFAMMRAVLPVMRARRRGYVLNMTSVAGLAGFPGSGYYAVSKHAVEGAVVYRARVGPIVRLNRSASTISPRRRAYQILLNTAWITHLQFKRS